MSIGKLLLNLIYYTLRTGSKITQKLAKNCQHHKDQPIKKTVRLEDQTDPSYSKLTKDALYVSHNLRKSNQFLNKDINERQQTVRQLKFCPNCLAKHTRGQSNSHYRCRIKNCNEFHNQQFTETTSIVHRHFHQLTNSKGTNSNINNKQTTRFKTILQKIITTIVVNTTSDTKHR